MGAFQKTLGSYERTEAKSFSQPESSDGYRYLTIFQESDCFCEWVLRIKSPCQKVNSKSVDGFLKCLGRYCSRWINWSTYYASQIKRRGVFLFFEQFALIVGEWQKIW